MGALDQLRERDNMFGQMRNFLDRTERLWMQGGWIGKGAA